MIIESQCHPHVDKESAHLFQAHDSGTTEIEYLELLKALVRVSKPTIILETGTYYGFGTRALARGCRDNGVGHVYTVDNQSISFTIDGATIVCADSIEWLSTVDLMFDFAFFDSWLPIRCKEFKICADRGLFSKGALAVFHDTSVLRTNGMGARDPESEQFWDQFHQLCDKGYFKEQLTFPLSRGMIVTRVP